MSSLFCALPLMAQENLVPDAKDAAENGILFVVDRSGSMQDELPKITPSVSKMVDGFPKDHAFGLIAFHGCGPDSVDEMVPFADGAGDKVKQTVSSIQSGGATDIVCAFQKVQEVITNNDNRCMQVVVFTDNMHTCPNGGIQEIRDSIANLCMQVNFVTSSVDAELVKYFDSIKQGTGGKVYKGASDKVSILKALDDIKRRGIKRPTTRVSDNPQARKKDEEVTDKEKPVVKKPIKRKAKLGSDSGSTQEKP